MWVVGDGWWGVLGGGWEWWEVGGERQVGGEWWVVAGGWWLAGLLTAWLAGWLSGWVVWGMGRWEWIDACTHGCMDEWKNE